MCTNPSSGLMRKLRPLPFILVLINFTLKTAKSLPNASAFYACFACRTNLVSFFVTGLVCWDGRRLLSILVLLLSYWTRQSASHVRSSQLSSGQQLHAAVYVMYIVCLFGSSVKGPWRNLFSVSLERGRNGIRRCSARFSQFEVSAAQQLIRLDVKSNSCITADNFCAFTISFALDEQSCLREHFNLLGN
jgi:hypothetical protein